MQIYTLSVSVMTEVIGKTWSCGWARSSRCLSLCKCRYNEKSFR